VATLFEPPHDLPEAIAPKQWLLRIPFDIAIGAAFGIGLAALNFAYIWIQPDARPLWLGSDWQFSAVVAGCLIAGILAAQGGIYVWREAQARVTPWIAAAGASWFASTIAFDVLPSQFDRWRDPRAGMGLLALTITGGMLVFAAIAFIDWLIKHNERRDDNDVH
jgi:hypothetical protein